MRRQSFRRAAALAGVVAAVAATRVTPCFANGRRLASVNVRFRPGDVETIYLPVTFGLVKSSDGGESFRWLCEAGIGYGGIYDPHYVVTPEGYIYATTYKGLRVSRDGGCIFETLESLASNKFISSLELGPDGRLWVPTSNGQGQNDVFVSEDGVNFVSAGLFEEKAWWLSVGTTPADAMRIYVTGYLPEDEEAGTERQPILRRSVDGGTTWEELETTDFTFAERRDVYILGVSPVNPDIVFARVLDAIPPAGDVLYRSEDGGLNWTKVATFSNELISFHIRPDGQTVIAGTVTGCPEDDDPTIKGCVRISRDAGVTWHLAKQQPRLACIGERADGTLFGCGENWDPDNFALGRSTDGESWEKVYRFSETVGPLDCPAETEQSQCAVNDWPDVCFTLGICTPPDAGLDANVTEPDDGSEGNGGGCCRVGDTADTSWVPGVLVLVIGLAWQTHRRRR